jgi:hypothetical protein
MMDVYDPTGGTKPTAQFAPRLQDLNGKKIGLLSNGHWQSHRTMPLLQDVLQKEFAGSEFVVVPANAAIRDDKTIDALIEEGYDAVIVGNAA